MLVIVSLAPMEGLTGRTLSYMMMFYAATVLPMLACLALYVRNKSSHSLRYFILAGYSIMYVFVLLTGSTTMVFTYIFPLLSLIVLYHQPKLVLMVGVVALLANLAYDARLYLDGMVTLETSKDLEIQLALIVLCFGFLYVASKLYDDINRQNLEHAHTIEEKNREIQQMTLDTITTIANIIDAKDEYTQGHSQRVAEYSSAIARKMGYSEEAIAKIRYIALMHDIGKIGIPDAVLKKPGRLDDDEFSTMKEHVDIGAGILEGNHMIEGLALGARYHHEKYDGNGYSSGLKGDDIPEIARIIGLADAYDAMTSDRVYRRRLSDEDVIEEIRRNRGTQFDPHIADLFLEMLEEESAAKQPQGA
ncbi:MAG: HD-GYP domain-containing protein [Coriobacteriales bacterium]